MIKKVIFIGILAIAPFSTHAATCSAGYFLDSGTCKECESRYYCPGNDTRIQCPEEDANNWQKIFTDEGYDVRWLHIGPYMSWGNRAAPTDCHVGVSCETPTGSFYAEPGFNGTVYGPGTNKLWFSATPGYYLSPYKWSSYHDWYSGTKPCTNTIPTHSHYSGPGTPDAPDGSIKDANDCPWACDDDYMLYAKAGTCVVKCTPGYALDSETGTCKACTGATYSDTTGATECTPCPTATAFKDRVTSYGYWTANGIHDQKQGCRAHISEDDTRGDYALSCELCNDDYGVTACDTACLATNPQSCIGGYYWSSGGTNNIWAETVEKIKSAACVPVGTGYYSPDGSLSRTACPAGTTTIGYGAGADEAADCGVALHIGDATVHLRSEKRTTHALHVRVGDQTFYGDMTTAVKGKVRAKIDDTVYSVYDDSM